MLCFVGSRIFGLVCFKLHSTGRYSCITAPQLHFYSQHWTRLANIQTNIQARLELTKQGLQSFFEGHPYILKQNFLWKTCRELFIKLCACGPDFVAWNEWLAMIAKNNHIIVTIKITCPFPLRFYLNANTRFAFQKKNEFHLCKCCFSD